MLAYNTCRKNKVVPAQIHEIQAVMLDNLTASRVGPGERGQAEWWIGGIGVGSCPGLQTSSHHPGSCACASISLWALQCGPTQPLSGKPSMFVSSLCRRPVGGRSSPRSSRGRSSCAARRGGRCLLRGHGHAALPAGGHTPQGAGRAAAAAHGQLHTGHIHGAPGELKAERGLQECTACTCWRQLQQSPGVSVPAGQAVADCLADSLPGQSWAERRPVPALLPVTLPLVVA